MKKDIVIFEVCEPEASLVPHICRLLSQLTSSPFQFGIEELRAIVDSQACHLFIAKHNNDVCGMLTLASYLAPTGRKMWIEDVVVDASMRGNSVGRRLVEYAIAQAKECGGVLMLTSKPSRVAANALYKACGFEPKETNVYNMKL